MRQSITDLVKQKIGLFNVEGCNIYLISTGDYIKLGYSNNMYKRLYTYTAHNPEIELLDVRYVEDALKFEKKFHKDMRSKVVLGNEWYDKSSLKDIMKYLDTHLGMESFTCERRRRNYLFSKMDQSPAKGIEIGEIYTNIVDLTIRNNEILGSRDIGWGTKYQNNNFPDEPNYDPEYDNTPYLFMSVSIGSGGQRSITRNFKRKFSCTYRGNRFKYVVLSFILNGEEVLAIKEFSGENQFPTNFLCGGEIVTLRRNLKRQVDAGLLKEEGLKYFN